MAAVIVQIKRNIKAKKEAQEARLARFPRSAKPNENDIMFQTLCAELPARNTPGDLCFGADV
jgi:hypothetical protein